MCDSGYTGEMDYYYLHTYLFQTLMSALLILATSMPHVLTPMAPIPVSAMMDLQEMDYYVKVMTELLNDMLHIMVPCM